MEIDYPIEARRAAQFGVFVTPPDRRLQTISTTAGFGPDHGAVYPFLSPQRLTDANSEVRMARTTLLTTRQSSWPRLHRGVSA